MTRRPVQVAVIIVAALGAVYLSLYTYTRIDHYLFPGNEVSVPAVPAYVPGTNIGVSVSLPGVSTAGPTPWSPDARLNILVLGLDRRPWEPKDASFRSDTMFVASIDQHAGRLQLLAIPRDTWAEIPYGNEPGVWAENKINAAYSYGQFYKYPGGGAAAAVAAVEHNFNIDIHHYVVIDWVGFVQLIDALGGIDLVVPEDISDFGTDVLDAFPDNTVKAGPQHMDGARALGYSRVRVDGDIKRIERQQIVIRAVADKSISLGYLAKIPELWEAYHNSFRTDVQTAQIPGFALLARQMHLETIETFSLAPALYSGIAEDGQLILLPNRDEIYAIIDRFFADPQVRDEAPAITIEFPDGQEEAARAALAHLEKYGVPRELISLRKAAAPGDPGIFDLAGKPYTAAKLTGLFDLRLHAPPEGLAAEGFDVLVRIGPATALKSP
jgi:LCP family protein required for cell wall assembly